jgi:hypothetical protein
VDNPGFFQNSRFFQNTRGPWSVDVKKNSQGISEICKDLGTEYLKLGVTGEQKIPTLSKPFFFFAGLVPTEMRMGSDRK